MRSALRSLATLGVVLVVYYAFPIGHLPSELTALLSVAVLVVGVGVLAWLIVGQLRQLVGPEADGSVRVEGLLALLYMSVLVFSLGYAQLAEVTDGQFSGLETKTDSLYFTVTTLATVGFGDIYAKGQLARGLVTIQVVFNLVFVGALASMLTSQLRQRAAKASPRK